MATNRPKPNKPGATKRKRPTKIDAVLKLLRRAMAHPSPNSRK